jgi:dolichol kinase
MTVLVRLLFAALLLSLISDHLRVERGWKTHVFAFLERAREVGRLHATTYTFIGSLLAFMFFDRDISYAAIAMFFIGDAAAAIFGRLWGKRKFIGKKSVLGTSAMLVCSLIAGWSITGSFGLGLTMAIVATLIEAVSDKMDDSFLIILFAGVAGQLLRFLLMF